MSRLNSVEPVGAPTDGHDDLTLPSVVVAVCTYRRNDQLRRFLEGVAVSASHAADLCRTGVVVVDDTVERMAEPVVRGFSERFELGLEYLVSGQQNISLARNVGLEAAVAEADWIAMTDDDCVPEPNWLRALVSAQQRTGADAVSGLLVRRVPADAAPWLSDRRLLGQGVGSFPMDADIPIASTHNSMVSGAWLRSRPSIRFDPALGRLGGEDMLFFRTAHAHGLRITYAADAIVFEDQPPERLTYRFILHQSFWLGNSTYVTLVESGEASRARMAMHGVARTGRAVVRPLLCLLRGRGPDLRYNLVRAAGGVGTLLGVAGIRVNHH